MKNKNIRTTMLGLYFVFCLILLLSEPVGPISPLGRIAFDLFAIGNLINLVRILRKPSTPIRRANQDAR